MDAEEGTDPKIVVIDVEEHRDTPWEYMDENGMGGQRQFPGPIAAKMTSMPKPDIPQNMRPPLHRATVNLQLNNPNAFYCVNVNIKAIKLRVNASVCDSDKVGYTIGSRQLFRSFNFIHGSNCGQSSSTNLSSL